MKFSSKICIPIQSLTMNATIKAILAAEKESDIIEIWLDHISDLDLDVLLKTTSKDLLLVNKGPEEKGKWDNDEQSRVELLITAATKDQESGRNLYLDIGIHTDEDLIHKLVASKKTAHIIISFHDFESTPSFNNLSSIVEKAHQLGAEIVKIATFNNSNADALTLLNVLQDQHSKGNKMIVLGMGAIGKVTRLAGCYMGNFLTFAPASKNTATASGQITVEDLIKIKKML